MGGDGFWDAALAAFGAEELEFISDGGFAVEVVEVDVEIIGDGFEGFHVGGAGALFVVADGGALDAELVGEGLLGKAALVAQAF